MALLKLVYGACAGISRPVLFVSYLGAEMPINLGVMRLRKPERNSFRVLTSQNLSLVSLILINADLTS